MKKNKIISLVIMLMFALTFIAPVTYASTLNDVTGVLEEQVVSGYPDVQEHWAEQTINKMLGEEVIAGYPDGTFKPDNSITRAEFTTIIAKAFELEEKPGKVFADTEKHWAKNNISIITANGIGSGYNDKEFGPDDFITREQMTVMTVKAAKLTELINNKIFVDSQNISDWAKDSVDLAVGNDLITGYPDNTFKPKGNASRAEAAVVLYKSMSLKPLPDVTVALTDDELSYFNGDLFFNGDYLNIHNQFLSSLYDEPADIDLFELFYCGSGISETMTDDELKAVMAKSGMTGSIENLPCPCEKNSRSNMDQTLTEYMGITLADTNEVGMDNFIYLPQYDAYYHLHGDTNYRTNIKFFKGDREGNLIRLFYNDTFFGDGNKVLTLQEKNGEYLFIANEKFKPIDAWGIQLNAMNVATTGMTLECKQLGGKPTGDLLTGSYYFLEKQMNEKWVAVEMLPSEYEIGWDDVAWSIPMDETIEWEVNWEWLYGELSGGNYRIGKEIADFRDTGDYDTKTYYTNFEVTN